MKQILNPGKGAGTVPARVGFSRAGLGFERHLLKIIAALALTPSFWLSASAQGTPVHSGISHVQAKPSRPAETEPPPRADSPPVLPPQPPTLEQLPPRPPQITWDGKQLSIKSENSTLADILSAVRNRTKTDIEIPAGAAQERVAVDLGPGPARDVLTSLLSGSNFDYIIQASDSDENAVQSVLLMAREKNDDGLSGTAVASASGGPLRRRAEAAVETAKEQASAGTRPSSETTVAEAGSESDTPASNGELASSQPGQGRASPAAEDGTSDTANAGTGQQIASAADASALPAQDTSSASFSMTQMVQNLQNLYEQRRQLQIQQNQSGAAPANVQSH